MKAELESPPPHLPGPHATFDSHAKLFQCGDHPLTSTLLIFHCFFNNGFVTFPEPPAPAELLDYNSKNWGGGKFERINIHT